MENTQTEKSIELLKLIKQLIEVYNKLNPKQKIVLQDEKKDVSDVFVCVYHTNRKDLHNKHIGLFRETKYYSHILSSTTFGEMYDAGSIFKGLDSNYIGIKRTHIGDHFDNTSLIGLTITLKDKTYVSNCRLINIISLDDLRFIMYQEGLITSYETGKASSQELLDILSYAASYYKLDQNLPSQKVKY